jgi:hypothetical protein
MCFQVFAQPGYMGTHIGAYPQMQPMSQTQPMYGSRVEHAAPGSAFLVYPQA